MDMDGKRLDWICRNRVSVSFAETCGEWRVCDYDVKNYSGFGATSREAIDNAMSNYGEDE